MTILGVTYVSRARARVLTISRHESLLRPRSRFRPGGTVSDLASVIQATVENDIDTTDKALSSLLARLVYPLLADRRGNAEPFRASTFSPSGVRLHSIALASLVLLGNQEVPRHARIRRIGDANRRFESFAQTFSSMLSVRSSKRAAIMMRLARQRRVRTRKTNRIGTPIHFRSWQFSRVTRAAG